MRSSTHNTSSATVLYRTRDAIVAFPNTAGSTMCPRTTLHKVCTPGSYQLRLSTMPYRFIQRRERPGRFETLLFIDRRSVSSIYEVLDPGSNQQRSLPSGRHLLSPTAASVYTALHVNSTSFHIVQKSVRLRGESRLPQCFLRWCLKCTLSLWFCHNSFECKAKVWAAQHIWRLCVPCQMCDYHTYYSCATLALICAGRSAHYI